MILKRFYIITIAIVLCSINSCITPTFESPAVSKGIGGWIGISGGYRCFDYGIIDEYTFEKTKGIAGSCGFNYGFSEHIGIISDFSVYKLEGYRDGSDYMTEYRFSGSVSAKFELTKKESRNVFSLAIGPAYIETMPYVILKPSLMVGFKDKKNTLFTIGTHLSNIFLNIGPADGSGFVVYLGYQIPVYNNPFNIGAGIGYRIK